MNNMTPEQKELLKELKEAYIEPIMGEEEADYYHELVKRAYKELNLLLK